MPATSIPATDELRDRLIRFRVSDTEYRELAQQADAAHLPLAALLRGLIAEGRRQRPSRSPDEDAERILSR